MNTQVSRLARWYLDLSSGWRTAARTAPIAIVAYLSALLSEAVAKSLEIEGIGAFVFVTIAIITVTALLMLVAGGLRTVVESVERHAQHQRDALGSAYELADKAWMLEEIGTLTKVRNGSAPSRYVLVPADPASALAGLVRAAFDTLVSHYGQSDRIDEKIHFEVTFMTRSYRDDEITIAAWANNEGRKPPSMQVRASNPKAYENTVTAEVYRTPQPDMRIVEDTSTGYAELYPRQKNRIKSSVVCPVLSADFDLLGTLVLHCDRSQFFTEAERKFWRMFCEIFVKRIALEKLLLDQAMEPTGSEVLGAHRWATPPF